MPQTDVISSTFSVIANDIFQAVHSNNFSGSNSSKHHNDAGSHSSFHSSNRTSAGSPVSLPTNNPIYAPESVTHGFSQGKLIAVMIMLIIFSVFGCLGNGLVLYVFSKKSDKVTSTIFILALAWTDFFSCLIYMPFTVAFIYLDDRLHFDFFCKLYQFINTSNVPLSAFIMVAIAFDRYFSICHPFKQVVTPRRARMAIICLVLIAFTLGSITACSFGVHKSDSITNASLSSMDNTLLKGTQPSIESHQDGKLSLISKNGTETLQLPAGKYMEIPISNRSVLESNAARANDTEVSILFLAEKNKNPQENVNGMCTFNELVFSDTFIDRYQKVYISFFIIALIAVFTLYFFIYRSVVKRRAWRRKQKSWSHSPLTLTVAATTGDNGSPVNDIYTGGGENLELSLHSSSIETQHSDNKQEGGLISEDISAVTSNPSTFRANTTQQNCSHENGLNTLTALSPSAEKKANRERRDFNFLANIRTAIMLFVVTLVFIISFLPAWLMATTLIPYEIIVFYAHCVYNVANPVIYAFMNQSFRKELKRVFRRGTK